MPAAGQTLRRILAHSQKELLAEWVQAQLSATTRRADLMNESELREQSREFLSLIQAATDAGSLTPIGREEIIQRQCLLPETIGTGDAVG